MCFMPKPPKLEPLPAAPAVDDAAVKQRQQIEAAKLQTAGGTPGTVKTDLAPTDVTGTKKVLLGV